ncbi:hypothetical protein Ancab_027847 [Ancistrocladus abbreviatus]
MGDSSVNLPPGFQFHPTDEELVLHFLQSKVSRLPSHPDVIPDLDLLPHNPWDLQGRALSEGRKWYFYSRPTPNRVADAGYWKPMGMDDPIYSTTNKKKVIGLKNSFVFHVGQPPEDALTNWVMHEYRLPDASSSSSRRSSSSSTRGNSKLDHKRWVLCKVYERTSEDSEGNNSDDGSIELSCLDEVFLSMDDLDEISSSY